MSSLLMLAANHSLSCWTFSCLMLIDQASSQTEEGLQAHRLSVTVTVYTTQSYLRMSALVSAVGFVEWVFVGDLDSMAPVPQPTRSDPFVSW